MDKNSVVDIGTLYVTGGSSDQIRLAARFPQPSRPVLRPTQPPEKWVLSLFPGDKAAGAWR